jgi:crotonobetainyl-CoA hydratase
VSGDESPVLTEVRGHVLIITLNRPDSRNALNAAAALMLGEAIETLEADNDLRVGVLTGAGAAFCAGMDLKAFAAGEPVVPADHPEWGFGGFTGHFTSKPVIAAVRGFAFGGGFELALGCDLVVAADDARFALPEVTRGLFAAGAGVPRILQQVPPKVGMRMLLTGQPMSASDAHRWGLVNELVPAEAVLDTALQLAETIAANAPVSIRTTKRLAAALTTESAWTDGAKRQIEEAIAIVFASEDAAEGAAAFAEKRPPVWKGR